MRLLDLYCGAGGAAVGYNRAGFDEIVGVDLKPQPRYPFEFVQADALTYPLDGFDAIHASPPCQAFTAMKSMPNAKAHPDLVAATRKRLQASGVPWVIENVPGAPLAHAVILCGTMFRLGCESAELRRHRLFETSWPVMAPCSCQHGWLGVGAATIGVYGHAGGSSRAQRYARRKNGQHFPTRARAEAMGIDWMTGTELSQAIPPCYTEFVGRCLLQWVG